MARAAAHSLAARRKLRVRLDDGAVIVGQVVRCYIGKALPPNVRITDLDRSNLVLDFDDGTEGVELERIEAMEWA